MTIMDSNLVCTFKTKYLCNEISLGGFIPFLRHRHLGNKADAILRKKSTRENNIYKTKEAKESSQRT